MEVHASSIDPPIGAYLTCLKAGINVKWGKETKLSPSNSFLLTNSHGISRHVARLNPKLELYPSDILERTEVDHWLSVASGPLCCSGEISSTLEQLNKSLAPSSYLTANRLTIADYEVFGVLYKLSEWKSIVNDESKCKSMPHLLRWFNSIQVQVEGVLNQLPKNVKDSLEKSTRDKTPPKTSGKQMKCKREEGGKFVELPGAKMGEVTVRFPPEASGYLHIGHAKAALLNQYYQEAFKGKLIMRFDDTNPDKEKADFEKVILEDVKLLNIKPDIFTHSSDHFDRMIEMCEKLMADGLAYADDTDAETMKKEREERQESKNRSNTLEKNMKMWNEMKSGTDFGQTCCIRAKIDMKSDNGCMRDPTIYRCKNEPHVKTGLKYKVYPTYDFACPIVDSVEGVTHALRTTEYHDRDDQYNWFIEKFGLRKVHIYEYSRLNMNNTVLSKRKLTWFVQEGIVDGWDDPRFPTVRGILRRGMTIEGLKEFIIAQGSSRSVVNMEWDKIWSFNKKVIDRDAPRYTSLEGDLVPVHVNGVRDEPKKVLLHPKDNGMGNKTIWVSSKVFIESVDAAELKEGQNATFINWGNLMIKKIHKEGDKIVKVDADPNLSDTDYKKTLKITWLADTVNYPLTPVVCVYFDHLIKKGVLGKDEDFKDFINTNTRYEIQMVGDKEMRGLAEGDIIQLQRKGFFRVDKAAQTFSPSSCRESPIVLFSIPDGHSKETPATSKKAEMSNKEKLQNSKGKKAEKSPLDENKPIVGSNNAVDMFKTIQAQEDKIKKLESSLKAEIELMNTLKKKFKESSGMDYKSSLNISNLAPKPISTPTAGGSGPLAIHDKIKAQGDKVRDLKANKADKAAVKTEVDLLLELKKQFKEATGLDWKPDIDVTKFGSAKSVEPVSTVSSGNNALDLLNQIKIQGDKIRDLKANKADKGAIKAEVDILLNLKNEFKNVSGMDWKPDFDASKLKTEAPKSTVQATTPSGNSAAIEINNKIKAQGDKVRELKTNKADKDTIKKEVDILLNFKKEFKDSTGSDWNPNIDLSQFESKYSPAAPKSSPSSADSSILDIHEKIKKQGDKVRDLKSNKADKAAIKSEVDVLLEFKKEFKDKTGIDWKPDIDISSFSGANDSGKEVSNKAVELLDQIKVQGDKIRELKANKAEKTVINQEVNTLLTLKADFKTETGIDWKPDINLSNLTKKEGSPKPNQHKEARKSPRKSVEKEIKEKQVTKAEPGKKVTRLGLEAKKSENLPEWYSQVITKAEMIEYYTVSGCYILRPWSYAIWDYVREFIDAEIKKLNVKNAYFPIFISKDALEKEKTHIADFSPEVAWVTKSGSSDLAEPIAIRPTSETVMYPAVAKWVQSHRDLPVRLNQWNNIVRWEFKQPTPFLRTREFLWQEGHSAFATKPEAEEEVYQILDIYRQVYENLFAIPVVKGKKTEKEKFAGGDYTTTTEAYVAASGRAIQGATSHHLGQNFSKMFDITFEDPNNANKKQYVYQNSWGLTTRTIGVMVMVHGDDKGLVLPPKVASLHCIIMPVGLTAKSTDEDKKSLVDAAKILVDELINNGIRAESDFRDHVTPAWKFNHWELKGVPLRIEIGPRELAAGKVFVVRRDNGEKQSLDRLNISNSISNLLTTIQSDMFTRAKNDLDNRVSQVFSWDDFNKKLELGNLLIAPFCGIEDCEDLIKKDSAKEEVEAGAPSMGAKSLCIPFEQPSQPLGNKCIHPQCNRKPEYFTLFGRSY